MCDKIVVLPLHIKKKKKSYPDVEKRADWLVVTSLQVHVAAIAELIYVPAPPKDSVTPCWHTTLSTTRKHKLPQECNSSNTDLSSCSSWPCSSLHPYHQRAHQQWWSELPHSPKLQYDAIYSALFPFPTTESLLNYVMKSESWVILLQINHCAHSQT